MTASGDPLVEPDRLIVEAATGARELSPDELRRVLEHVAGAGFHPAANAPAGGRLAGLVWQGRVLRGSDRLTAAEVHYLRHTVAQQEWPPGTTLDDYLASIRDVVLAATSGILVSRMFDRYWQLTAVHRSGPFRGPRGHEWLMVEYRVGLGHWVTAFQPEGGLALITQGPARQGQRWLRQPT
jgi:hypothetical protein